MRTAAQRKTITDRYESATLHKNIVNQGFIDYLLNQFRNTEHIKKSTGPVVMNYSPDRDGYEEWFEPVQKFVNNTFAYHTFFCEGEKEFMPILNDEHSGYAWVGSDKYPKPLHPGLFSTINIDNVVDKLSSLKNL